VDLPPFNEEHLIMTNTTTTDLLAYATEAETNAATQDAEAAAAQHHINTLQARLADAQADRKRAHRKATRLDHPNRHAQGRAELRHIDENIIPAIQQAIAAAQTDVDHYAADAARLRAVAADYRAQHAAATAEPVTVTTPAAFIDWYADYGTDKITDADADTTLTAARTASRTTAPGERVKITTADPRILDGLITAAAAFIASTRECIDADPDNAGLLARDIRITEKFKDRIREARAGLLAQEPSNLTQWERETLIAAQGPQDTPAAPAAPQEATTAAQGPQEAAHAPASVWVTTQDGERI
jgi:hypothetical protein